MATFGYAGKILRVDLSSRKITEVSTLDYSDKFLGGRGIAAKIYWDEVPPEVGAFDADNRLIFATGPLAGVPTIGGSRWAICGKSAESIHDQFSYSNLGGRWGTELKFAGYDAIVVHGKAEKPVYLFLHDDVTEIKDASHLWGKGAIESRETLKSELGKSARVVAIGPAGENMVTFSSLLADNDASGSGGLGASMGAKNLKAIVVAGAGRGTKIAHPERFKELVKHYLYLDKRFAEYLFHWAKDMAKAERTVPDTMKKIPCYGCLGHCPRKSYRAADGQEGKFMCHAAFFYQPWTQQYYEEWNDVPFYATKLCDTYGLDAVAMDILISWLEECYKAGILNDKNSGLPLSKLGSQEFIETLIHKISFREGIGDALAQGMAKAADIIGDGTPELLARAGYLSEKKNDIYGPRLYLTNAFIYAMEPRIAIHQIHEIGLLMPSWLVWDKYHIGYLNSEVLRSIAKRFWGSELAADFSTFEGKAMAAKMIQERQYAKECLILCDYLWPIMSTAQTENHIGDPTLESKFLSAVTGAEVDEGGLYKIGERVFNLQRAILVREGHRGRDFDCISEQSYAIPLEYDISNPDCMVPGKDGEVISRKGAVVDRGEFEKSKDEYYQLRQWDVASGLQTRDKLEELGLKDVALDLEQRGLLGTSGQAEHEDSKTQL